MSNPTQLHDTPTTVAGTPRVRASRSAGPLPPPPDGLAVVTRIEAASLLGMKLGTFSRWERAGRVGMQRYRATQGTGRAIYYARADVERCGAGLASRNRPYPDPERPGVYRVPIRSEKYPVEALIEAADLPLVEGKQWNVSRRGKDGSLEVILSTTTQRATPLKRLIMGVDAPECKEQIVCHANGDTLDCRRGNLLVTSFAARAGSTAKVAIRAGSAVSSRYKGVTWDVRRRVWKAQIGRHGGNRVLGRFRDEAMAAACYDDAARAAFGPAALLNFPDGVVPAPTFTGPDGAAVREIHAYRVPRGLPVPPPGAAMLTREQAAGMLEIAPSTLRHWEMDGGVTLPRYRERETTGTHILYAAKDIEVLRERLDAAGQPYADPHPQRTGVWRVPIRTLGGPIEALIDEADLHLVRGSRWNYVVSAGTGPSRGVVVRADRDGTSHVQLKRLVLGLQDEERTTRVVYANGNPLDCRRSNLLVRGPEQSTRRGYKILARAGRPTTSRYKGVCWLERVGAWVAQIRVDDVQRKLGLFDDDAQAALAYDEAAREIWGSQARVNFPEPGELPSAAAPLAPADLSPRASGLGARTPAQPTDLSAVLHEDGSVTLAWTCANAAASTGVTFDVLRRLPGQSEGTRIASVEGTTGRARVARFTDTTVPVGPLAEDGHGVEYVVRWVRRETPGTASDALVVRRGAPGTRKAQREPARGAA